MKDIDGYVTKDDLYRLISHIKRNPDDVVDDKTCHTIVNAISNMPASGVQPIVDTKNMATVSDEFICKKCGLYLKDYIKVVLDEDNDGYIDEQHYDYEPKFCPECGAKVMDGEQND